MFVRHCLRNRYKTNSTVIALVPGALKYSNGQKKMDGLCAKFLISGNIAARLAPKMDNDDYQKTSGEIIGPVALPITIHETITGKELWERELRE